MTALDPCFEKLQSNLRALIGEIAATQFDYRPSGKWSTAEVLEHLYRTYTGTIKGFERVAAAGRPLGTTVSWKQRPAIFAVVKLGYLPSGGKAPAAARPVGLSREQIFADILPAIERMDEIIYRCEQQFGPHKKLLDHPLLGSLTGQEWRKFHLVHGLHHIKQIRRLQEAARKSAPAN